MDNSHALVRLTDQPALDTVAEPLSQAVRSAYEAAGTFGLQAKNAMHGVWLGHPLHPVFTGVPLGAWTTALAFDTAAIAGHDRSFERAADTAIAVGLVGAAGAAVTGLTDWSETSGQSRRMGLVHGLLNISATMLYAASYVLRKNGSRSAGRSCALVGYGIAAGAAWFGGELVFNERIGVTHATSEAPEQFTTIAKSADVDDNSMCRAQKSDVDALLVRQHRHVCALAHSCSHLGGPLSEGTLKDGTVVCPWHGSEFRLDDGGVVNGPATESQPVYDVREKGGAIKVRARG
jgi:nitrite reductase/ring-hydroxylating ferredoxin subunit/uncharacterized membrane protein